jgi:hypothetical protein
MRLRGTRRRRGVDRGFILSDHADWPALHEAIGATGPSVSSSPTDRWPPWCAGCGRTA